MHPSPDIRSEFGRAGFSWISAAALALVTLTTAGLPGSPSEARFRFMEPNERSLQLVDGDRPVLVYNHGIITPKDHPADRARSTYIHPLYGLDGEVLTDDFPGDHPHHRGLFWAWPHVRVGTNHHDLWMLQGVRQQFGRWLARKPDLEGAAVLGVENGWYVGDRQVMSEQAWFRVHTVQGDTRAIDVELTWVPANEDITLSGAEGKSYGGLTLRYAPRTNTVITTPLGQSPQDLAMTRLPWADLSAQFQGSDRFSGAAILISPKHPDFPPTWLTRHYGCLCVGWPGVQERTFRPGEPIRCAYRVLIHRGRGDVDLLTRAAAEYASSAAQEWVNSARSPQAESLPRAQQVEARQSEDRVSIHVDGRPFTEYIYPADAKYPYFYPVMGPRSGRSVTVHKTEPYPHHSSLFFGCDRVNGGNYWQEGLERGRIVSEQVRILRNAGERIEFEQECLWRRPQADSPFSDHRRISVSAPTPDLRWIDVEITLTARTDVKIEKTNHSLFAVRVAPDLAVNGGGRLINAHGGSGEAGTFGKPSPWADYSGTRDGIEEGVAILSHPSNRWFPEPWFTRDYGFMSPTPLNWIEGGSFSLAQNETLKFRYRVVVHAGAITDAEKAAWFEAWAQ